MVDISNNLLEFLQNNGFLNCSFNLSNVFILSSDFNNFFIFLGNLFDSFHDQWNLDNLFNNILNVSVDIDKLRNDLFNLNNSWNFNHLLLNSFDLIDFGDNNCLFDNFFTDLFCSYDFLNCLDNWNNLLLNNLNLFNLFSNIWNLFDDLSNFSINNNFLLDSNKLEWLRFNCILTDNLLNYSWDLDNSFTCFSDWN